MLELKDWDTHAKLKGINAATLRSRLIQGLERGFIHVCDMPFTADPNTEFQIIPRPVDPDGPWLDCEIVELDFTRKSDGARWDPIVGNYCLGPAPHPIRRTYKITGWLLLTPKSAAKILAHRDYGAPLHELTFQLVGALSNDKSLQEFEPFDWRESSRYVHNSLGIIFGTDIYFATTKEVAATKDHGKLDARREKSLLRVISALCEMNHLPVRGAASPIELQLHKLGFDGPNEETIKKIVDEARALKP